METRLIPREGIYTPDFALSVFRSTALNPLLTGSLLVALRSLPRQTVLRWSQTLRLGLLSPKTLATLKYLFIIGAARQANKVLSSLVLNNWTSAVWDWKNEVALVTGGSSGIGYNVAVGLARHGVTVAVVDLQEPLAALPPNVHFYKGDVTSSSSIKAFAEEIRKAHGNPSILFNNAGIGGKGTIIEEDEAQLRKVFDVNTISHFLMVKEFVPSMIEKNHGHIITTASIASFVSPGGIVDYCCTKASALAFHEGLSQELRILHKAPKVRMTVVHPGWTRTPLVAPLLAASGKFRPALLEVETVADAIVAQIMSGRSAQLVVPPSETLTSFVRGWPSWAQETFRTLASEPLKHVVPRVQTRLEK